MFNVHWQYLFSKLVYLTFVDQKPYAHFAKSTYSVLLITNHTPAVCCDYYYSLDISIVYQHHNAICIAIGNKDIYFFKNV